MISIFKKASGAPAVDDKVKDYNFKDHYPDINMNVMWSEVWPYIRKATRTYVLPYIGQAMYDDIAGKVQADTGLNTEQTEFLERLRDAVAYYTIMVMLPKRKTSIASMGVLENVAKEGTSGTSLWGFKTTLWSVAQDADKNMDELLAYMEAQVKADNAYFDLWKDADEFNQGRNELIRTTAEFHEYRNINNSRRTFLALLPIMRRVIDRHLVPAISQAQYDELVTQVAGNTLTNANKALLKKVKPVIAAWSVHYAADSLTVLPDHDGFRVISNTDAIDQRQYTTEVITTAIDRIKYSAVQEAREALAELVGFLHDNAATYTLWQASTSNPDNDTDGPYMPLSSDYGGVWL